MPNPALEKILEAYPQEKDKKLILSAFEFAQASHAGQKRFSGQDYIIHPLRTALVLSQLGLDSVTIAAGLLHDVIDDTQVSSSELENRFGKEISFLVKGVSSLGKLRLPKQNLEIGPADKSSGPEMENLRRMFFAMAEDIRVILIKLADRVHNMETLEFIPKEKQKRFALETLDIFAPLAGRLGISTIKTKLENLAFPYLYPKEYQWLTDNFKEKREQVRECLDRDQETLKKLLKKEGIEVVELKARLKSSFSLYRKLLSHDMDFDRVYDLAAMRLVVKDIRTCYEILGVIHKYWKPLPGRIKDYIAFPKANGYQSLHTTVICDKGKTLEVQIRTPQMHAVAEYGICAHWAKKEGVSLLHRKKQFAWIQQLAGWQKENKTSKEFLEGLKIDFFKDRIFVFTPKGDIIDLPDGATTIDFAYAVHSEIGDHCSGAKVNNKLVPLSEALKTGDIVEILTDKNKKPSRDWLKLAKTNLAKSHIKKQTKAGLLQRLKEKLSPARLFKKTEGKEEKIALPVSVLIGGKPGIAFTLAKCCQPKVSEQISAYLTRGKGATIHLQSCQNLKRLKSRFPGKVLEAKWQ